MILSFRILLPTMLAVSLLAGCAGGPRAPVQAYQGPVRPLAEVALLELPEHVQVMAIDGREPPPSFLRSSVVLALLPGEHVLSLRHVQLFQLNSEEHEVVRSRQAALRFVAVASGRYRVDAPLQDSVGAARQFAREPVFRLVDAGGGAAVESVPVKSYAEASLIDTLGRAFDSQSGEAGPVSNTDLLKDIWSRSSSEERQAFRIWINEQAK